MQGYIVQFKFVYVYKFLLLPLILRVLVQCVTIWHYLVEATKLYNTHMRLVRETYAVNINISFVWHTVKYSNNK